MQASMRRTQADSGVNFLRGSKVGSATGYLCVAGQILALPHGSKGRSRSMPTGNSFTAQSEAGSQYREMPHCYASMDRKPMMRYDPNASRSRLAIDDAPVPYKNASTIVFNDRNCVHKRRFVTTASCGYTGEAPDPRTNTGILSESFKFKREMNSK